MTLKSMISSDVETVFMNTDEFATENGVTLVGLGDAGADLPVTAIIFEIDEDRTLEESGFREIREETETLRIDIEAMTVPFSTPVVVTKYGTDAWIIDQITGEGEPMVTLHLYRPKKAQVRRSGLERGVPSRSGRGARR
jgi:hypothetical protein